ncbi:glycosyltransferase family 4 protein [Paenibacillus mucilaginosus]|uniref:Glycosyl transferase group 1 n=1 Tax=Paenibacillus mucilaginosus (strain KNP414) TaxID=1036673 RepID=F8F7Q5_PAEMK|nr:glycosyltransferase family 4 protein [Paenibacillus mucilaginosus]AEI39540.1 hypothetical protein KNP414_00950 [Paenibacillus mucilaginosus KNP414]MCG7214642.1 glycosyltransferase family 4 protein [Paenibacillus mucilaginosus]WDM28497.1 glycosyltransferase family 4 protein [Paenibacillus mucilaginosus]
MKIMTVANAKTVKGGITSVVNSLIEGITAAHPGCTMARHASYIDSVHPLLRIIYSLWAMLLLLFKLPFYKIYHLHSAADGSFYRKALYTFLLRLFGKKVIFHIHGSSFQEFHDRSRFNAWLIRRTLNRSNGIIVLSEQMKGLVLTYCGNEKIWILPNPIQVPAAWNAAGEGEDRPVQLLFMGEIGPRKGIYDLVEALSRLDESARQRTLLHVCGNHEIEKLKRLIEEKQLTDTCIVHGWIDGETKAAMLKNADVYILPSYQEGLPVSILEAMAYELPIISTNVGGIPEVVLNNENGFVITPGDVEALGRAVIRLTEDAELRRRFGQKSRSLVAPHDLGLVVGNLHQIYKSVASG